jgi:hypothetical protein
MARAHPADLNMLEQNSMEGIVQPAIIDDGSKSDLFGHSMEDIVPPAVLIDDASDMDIFGRSTESTAQPAISEVKSDDGSEEQLIEVSDDDAEQRARRPGQSPVLVLPRLRSKRAR